MQVFRPIEHAITDDGEWIAVTELPVDYMGQLRCDSCHANVVVTKNKFGEEVFVHSHPNLQEITKTRSCHYTIRAPAPARSPGTGRAIMRPVKAVQPVTPISPLGPRILRIKTTQRKWHCVWCGHLYYGTKQCPQCREWTYTLEEKG